MVGIYKITSPSGKVYIGQSWDIHKRWIFHKCCPPNGVPHLTNSIKKHGWANHIKEVIHELPNDVEQSVLDRYEQIYMDAYRDCGITLMNCKEGGSTGKLSLETIEKIRKKNTGKKRTEEFKKAQGERAKNYIRTDEWAKNIADARKKNGFVPWIAGRKMSDEYCKNNSAAIKKWWSENQEKIAEKVSQLVSINSKPVIQSSKSGEFIKEWKSAREAERGLGIFSTSIAASIRGVRCKHAGGFKWEYA